MLGSSSFSSNFDGVWTSSMFYLLCRTIENRLLDRVNWNSSPDGFNSEQVTAPQMHSNNNSVSSQHRPCWARLWVCPASCDVRPTCLIVCVPAINNTRHGFEHIHCAVDLSVISDFDKQLMNEVV
ncbi:hypothetical protein J6590_004815 [Homalodisca vitripennis]|nr:hypothetical protein J6590_004815 [Homalodisca vitripennis]